MRTDTFTTDPIRWPDAAISTLFYLGLAVVTFIQVLELLGGDLGNVFMPALALGAIIYPSVFAVAIYRWIEGGDEGEEETP